jgi:ISXO2-like transposase domain
LRNSIQVLHFQSPQLPFGTSAMKRFAEHKTINHSRTYGLGDTHTNTIEKAFSLLKRGVYGTFHKASTKHLGRYCHEFSYRFNRRGEQSQMFDETLEEHPERKSPALQKAHGFARIGVLGPRRP